MEILKDKDGLAIKQIKEWGEIITGFEMKNKYQILDKFGHQILFAGEASKSLLSRLFLKQNRPFEIRLFDDSNQVQLTVRRPFRWFFHECSVFDKNDTLIGGLKMRFAIFRRKYDVTDSLGNVIMTLFGPALKPWTFEIRRGDNTIGSIVKKWTGFGKEMFTDADNFGINYESSISPKEKAILLGGVFLIDFMYFERK